MGSLDSPIRYVERVLLNQSSTTFIVQPIDWQLEAGLARLREAVSKPEGRQVPSRPRRRMPLSISRL
jgi:hypothetical protein